MQTLEEQVKQYLNNNGISQVYFAKLIGISSANAGAMFNGKRKMKADELLHFCEHYGLTLDYFKKNSQEVCGEN